MSSCPGICTPRSCSNLNYLLKKLERETEVCFLSFSSRPPLKLSFSFLAPMGTKCTGNPFFPLKLDLFSNRGGGEESPEDFFPEKGRFGTLGGVVPLSNGEEESNKFCPFPLSPLSANRPWPGERPRRGRERDREKRIEEEEEEGGSLSRFPFQSLPSSTAGERRRRDSWRKFRKVSDL